MKHKPRVIEGDAFDIVKQNRKRPAAVFFIDPPYTVAGRRLYRHASVDHNGLFHLMSQTTGDFLMTYDNTEEIVQLAEKYGFQHREIVMKSTHHRKKMELLIGGTWNGSENRVVKFRPPFPPAKTVLRLLHRASFQRSVLGTEAGGMNSGESSSRRRAEYLNPIPALGPGNHPTLWRTSCACVRSGLCVAVSDALGSTSS